MRVGSIIVTTDVKNKVHVNWMRVISNFNLAPIFYIVVTRR